MRISVNINNKEYFFDLESYKKDVVSFGRNKDCDIVLNDPYISRVQGCFYKENGTWCIKNLGGTNGLYYKKRQIDSHVLNNEYFYIPTAEDRFIVIKLCDKQNNVNQAHVVSQGPKQAPVNARYAAAQSQQSKSAQAHNDKRRAPSTVNINKKKDNKKAFLIGGITAGVALIAIMFVFLLRDDGDSNRGGGGGSGNGGSEYVENIPGTSESGHVTSETGSDTSDTSHNNDDDDNGNDNNENDIVYDHVDGIEFINNVDTSDLATTNTVMIYMVGSNLESDKGLASMELEEMMYSGYDTSKTNVVILTGGTSYWHSDVSGDVNSIIRIKGNGAYVTEGETLTIQNMGSASTLVGFLDFCYENYKAEHYSLIFWDHGGGPVYGFGVDELYDRDMLDFNELKNALGSSKFKGDNKFDFIGFDACLMGAVEYANMLQSFSKYLIASSEIEPGYGWNYSFLSSMNNETDVKVIAQSIIDDYFSFYEAIGDNTSNLTMSCYDLSYVDDVVSDLDVVYENLIQNMTDEYYMIAEARKSSFIYGVCSDGSSYDMVDLIDFVEGIQNSHPEEASKSLDDMQKMIVYHKAGTDGEKGISIYFPYDNKEMYDQMGKYVMSSISISDNYTRFVDDYYNMSISGKAREKSVFRGVFSNEKNVFDQNDGVKIQLSEEQKKNVSKVTATFFYRISWGEGERYWPVLLNHEIKLESDGVINVPYDQSVYMVTMGDNSICIPFEEIQSIGKDKRLVSQKVAYTIDDMLLDYTQIDINILDSNGKILLLGITESDNENGKAEYVSTDWYDYLINFNRVYTPTYGVDGNLLPYEEWWDEGSLAGNMISIGDDIKVESKPLKDCDEDIYCLITIEDIYGDKYTLDFQKVSNNDISGEYNTDDGTFYYTEIDGGIRIDGYSGAKDSITVPDTINLKSVTEIGDSAFENSTIKEIKIPGTIKKIGGYAFYSCESLEKIVIPEGVKYIGNNAFTLCTSLSKVDIPMSCETIGERCFFGCSALKKVVIPSGVKNIGKAVVTDSVLEIDNQNAYYCVIDNSLYTKDKKTLLCYFGMDEKYNIPDGTVTIGSQAFSNNFYLKSVTIPDSVKVIGNKAFFEVKLEEVNIPANIEAIGSYAFGDFSRFNIIPFDDIHFGENFKHIGKHPFDSFMIDKFTVDRNNLLFSAKDGFVTNRAGDVLLLIPDSVGDTLVIPDGIVSVRTIEEYNSIKTVVLNDKVIYLDGSKFKNAEKIEIGKKLRNWDNMTDMNNLKEISISDENDNYKFSGGAVFTKDGTKLLYYMNNNTESEYRIPDGVVSISTSAFLNSKNIKKLIIPATVTDLGYNKRGLMHSLSKCSSLEYIEADKSNPDFVSENGLLYSGDGKTLLCVPDAMTNVINIREGTEIIDNYAICDRGEFADSEEKINIEIHVPEGVKIIRTNNFIQPKNVNYSVYLPETLEEVSYKTFKKNSDSGEYIIYGKSAGMAERIAKNNQIEFKEK
ncbi:Leucine rich repeat-containing protein [Eubacterium ruminantium]|nr:Leucine rich repeat-containing protein [Eubacterium ruminantium]